MDNTGTSAAGSEAARALEEGSEEILADYERRLEVTHNLLVVGRTASREERASRARALLERAAETLRGEKPSTLTVGEEVQQNTEAAGDPLIQHPDESYRAGMELCKAALEVLAQRLESSGRPPREVMEVSLAVQESIMDYIARVAMVSYVDYLLTKINETQVEERQHFSRELHDRVAHAVALVSQNLELYEALRGESEAAAGEKLAQARDSAREAIEVARDLSQEMRHAGAGESLRLALGTLVNDTLPQDMECSVSFEGDEEPLPPHVRDQLYMVLREGVRNAVVHSRASGMEIEVEISGEEAVAAVADDGDGFDPQEIDSDDGVGLQSMRERVQLLGGSFDLSSAPASGTRVEARIPLKRRK